MPPSLNAQDTRPETIDVDALFEDIEITKVRSAARARIERMKSRGRTQNRTRTQVSPGSDQRPINLVSDDEDDTPSQKKEQRAQAVGNSPGQMPDVSHETNRKAYSKSMDTPFQSLKQTLTAGSPSTLMPTPGPSKILRPYITPKREKSVTVIEDSDVEMDVDEPSASDLHAPGNASSSKFTSHLGSSVDHESDSSLYSLSGFAEFELKDDPDDLARALAFIDMHAMLGLVEEDRGKKKGDFVQSATLPRVSSRTMKKYETSGTWIQAKDPYRRIWDAPASAYPTSLYKSFEVDLPRRIVRKELDGRSPSSWPRHAPSLNCELTATPLRLISPQYKKTSGSITKIAQSHGHIAVASATSGGQPDAASDPSNSPQIHPEIDPYNTDGNLLVWTGKEFFDLKAHTRTWILNSQQRSKVYTVNDVAFDPQRLGRLVSSGNDGIVHIWDLQNLADGSFEPRPLNHLELHYSDAPHDIAFKPNSSIFAVACFDGNVHIHSENEHNAFQVVFDRSTSKTGAFLWGGYSENQGLSDLLFASSESEDDSIFCKHAAFDVEQGRELYSFMVDDSGDSMALNPKR
ncbi:hypothetical protein EW145_g7885 [Phellinidium pouzarii]|uniref:Uncharacterized protein n=1 Tax=Phellinidium pouzarii TaxID=167371 RepID=A0A4S4KCU1_9AGAM|nr:hypothetical protein EW145_g7885 [Phellinidium pouzarii]